VSGYDGLTVRQIALTLANSLDALEGAREAQVEAERALAKARDAVADRRLNVLRLIEALGLRLAVVDPELFGDGATRLDMAEALAGRAMRIRDSLGNESSREEATT
jgi:hypothetical protein